MHSLESYIFVWFVSFPVIRSPICERLETVGMRPAIGLMQRIRERNSNAEAGETAGLVRSESFE